MSGVIGIDPSTKKLAMFQIGNRHHTAHVLEFRAGSEPFGPGAVVDVFKQVADWLRGFGPHTFVVEAPIMGVSRNVQTAVAMAQVVGACISATGNLQKPPHILVVPPSTWKKEVCGHGGLDKSGVGRWLERERPEWFRSCGGDGDLVDAACLADYGVRVRSRLTRLAGSGELQGPDASVLQPD